MRQALVAGNWKMHGASADVDQLLKAILESCQKVHSVEWAVFPPYIYIPQAESVLRGSSISWGAQNLCTEDDGAYTGEISASMLADLDCRYVIVGHSERRHLYHEDNHGVAVKFIKALQAGLRPILCVGETLEERDHDLTLQVVQEQLAAALLLADNLPGLNTMVVAYEPVWAIGTGKTATPDQAQEVHAAIRHQLDNHDAVLSEQVRILYGGSVKPDNAAALSTMPDIDGALVGGASLEADKFLEIGKQWNN